MGGLVALVAASIIQHPNYTQPGCSGGCCFVCWGYCGGLVLDGLSEALDAGLLPHPLADATASLINKQLDYFIATPGQPGWEILNGSVPRDSGDCGE